MTAPFRRRGENWSSPHERARARAAERLDSPLDPADNAWLDRHLAECAACRAVAEAYQSDRHELRAFRRNVPEPPRDLWARTAAAIEREAAPGAPAGRSLRRRLPSAIPLGAVSGVLVIAVVFGAALLSGRPTPSIQAPSSLPPVAVSIAPTRTTGPRPTPLVVPQGGVDWVAKGDDGQLLYNKGQFSEVCSSNGAQCPPVQGTSLPIEQVTAAEEVVVSPNEEQLVVVDNSAAGSTIVVVPVPTPTSEPGPAITEPPVTEPPVTEPPTIDPSSAPPSDEPSSAPPSSEPSPTPGPLEIAGHVIVVGETAFSADGAHFAFSARPADDSQGPDIFVWTVGDTEARPITDDHRSVFSGWLGDLVLGSRPADPASTGTPDASGAPASPEASTAPDASSVPSVAPAPAEPTLGEAFVIDPASGVEAVVANAGFWRPAVDPTGTRAVYWEGTIELDESGIGWQPAEGRLVVGAWPGTPVLPAPPAEPDASSAPLDPNQPTNPPGSPQPTPPVPTESAAAGDPPVVETVTLVDGPVRDWEARWDETGRYLAVWIADADDTTIGRLTLYAVNAETDLINPVAPLLGAVPSLPGFAIGDRHLAWATKEGEDGKSSVVKVVAWTDDGIGQVETQQGEGVIVVQH